MFELATLDRTLCVKMEQTLQVTLQVVFLIDRENKKLTSFVCNLA